MIVYIHWYNTLRLRSALGNIVSVELELIYSMTNMAAQLMASRT